ncbi:MAG: hypothetical protein AAF682_29825 [Planctomycetota bacterium]
MRVLRQLLLLAPLAVPAAAQTTWTGAASDDWNDALNWSAGVPGAADDAVVPAGTPNAPSSYGADPVCLGLTIDAGASMSLASGFDLTVGGTLDLAGALSVASGSEVAVAADLVLADGADLDADGELDVDGAIQLGDASTAFDLGGLAHTVGTDFTSSGASATSGTLVFDGGGGTIDTGGGSLDDVQVTSGVRNIALADVTGDLAMTGGVVVVQVDGLLAVGGQTTLSGGALSLLTNARLDAAGDVDVSGATASVMDPSSRIEFEGDWTGSTTWNPLAGAVVHDGGGSSFVLGQPTFFDLTNESGLLFSSVTVSIQGDLTLEDSFASSLAVTVGGDVSLGASADWALEGQVHVVAGDWTSSGGSAINGAIDFTGDGLLSTGSGSVPTIQCSGGVRRAETSTVTGDLALVAGTLRILNDQTLTVQGNATLAGGLISWFPTATGADEVLLVEGDVLCNVGIELESTSARFVCRGTWASNASFTPALLRVVLDGSASQLVLAPELHDLTVSGGVATFIAASSIGGDVSVEAGGVLDANAVLDVGGSVAIDATAVLDGGGFTHKVAGDWSQSGGYVGPGAIELDGTGSLSTGASSLGNVVVSQGTRSVFDASASGNFTLTGGNLAIQAGQTLSVAGNLVLDAGTLTFNGSSDGGFETIDVAGNVVMDAVAGATSDGARIRVAGNWDGTGTWIPSAGTVVFDGGGASSILGTFPFFFSIEVENASLSIVAPTVLGGDLTVRSGQTLTVTGIIMTVLGSVLLEPTSTWNIASLTKIAQDWQSTGAAVNGTGTLEFNSGGTLTTGASTLPNVNVSNGGRQFETSSVAGFLSLSGGFSTILDNQTVTVGGNLEMIGGQLSFQSGAPGPESLIVDGDADVQSPAGTMSAEARIEVRGDWTSTSTWAPASGVVSLAPAASATLGGTAPTFATLEIASGTVDALVPTTVQSNLVVQSGALLQSQAAFNVQGGVTLGDATAAWDLGGQVHTVAGGFGSAGASASGPGVLELVGAGTLATGAGSVPNVLVTGGARSFGAGEITGDLGLTGGSAEILGGAVVTVGGNASFTGGALSFGAGTLDVEGDVTLAGTAAGAHSPAAELRCAGNWTSDSVYAPAEGTVVLDGAGLGTIGGAGLALANVRIPSGQKALLAPATLRNLDLLSGATLLALGAFDASGNVSLGDASASVDLGTLSHTVTGDWISNGASATNGAVLFDGDGLLRTGAGTLPIAALTAGTRTVEDTVLTGNLVMTGGTLELAAGQTLHVQGNADLFGGTLGWLGIAPAGDGTLDVDGDVTCQVQAGATNASALLRCGGDWASDGTFAPASGTVELDGTGLLTAAAPGFDPTFADLRVLGGTRTLAGDMTLSFDQLIVASGAELAANGTDVTFPGGPVSLLGALSLGVDTRLALGASVDLIVAATGTLSARGALGAPAVIAGSAGGGYSLSVDGTLDAKHFRFEDVGPAGVVVTETAAIAELAVGAFASPSPQAASTLLDIRRPAPTELRYVDFEDAGGVGTYNVTTLGGSTILITESDGGFAGAGFELDPLNLVTWVDQPTVVTDFTATASPDRVSLAWTSTAEVDLEAWVIERATAPGGPFAELVELAPIGPSTYGFEDLSVVSMQPYFYRLQERKDHGELGLLGEANATPWSSGLPPTVLTVGPSGAFADPASAIAAAFPGAVLLIEPGTYSAFTVTGAGIGTLRIYGDGTGPVVIDTSLAPVTIQNLGGLDVVELSDLTIGDPASPNAGIEVLNCTGLVVLDELVVEGGASQPGLLLQSSLRVAVQRCTVAGAPGAKLESSSGAVFGRGALDEIDVSGFSFARLAELAPAQTVEAGSSLTFFGGVHADVDAPELVPLGVGFTLNLDGEPGGLYGLAFSSQLAWFDLPSPPWEMVALLNLAQAPLLATGVLLGPTALNLPLPADGAIFGATLPLQMVVVNPITAKFRWSNVASIVLGN